MARDKLTEYSATASENTVCGDVNIAENSALPSDLNNYAREIMTHLKEFADGTNGINVLSLADDDASAAIKFQAPSAVTATVTFTLPDGDGADGQALITNGSGTLAWAYPYGNRNLIINGAMQVAQRGASSTGFVDASSYLTVDRFLLETGSSGTFTVSQATDAPAEFANSLKIDCTTADASPNYFLIVHRMEGQNLQHLNKGTSLSKKTTLSFYVKSNKTGTYQVNLRDVDNSRITGKTYTISAANTWEKKTVTFDGDTSGALGNDNGNSLQLEFWIASGSTYNSGAVPTAWEAFTNADRAAGLNVAIGASTDDEFYITGVQLEVGEQATPFEHRSFGDELLRCQRYFVLVADGNDSGTICNSHAWSAHEVIGHMDFGNVEMRANPTMSVSNNTHFYIRSGGHNETSDAVYLVQIDKKGNCRVEFSGSGGLTTGRGAWVRTNDANAYIHADAEL